MKGLMNKQELIQSIKELPKFELKEIYVQSNSGSPEKQKEKAVCEVGKNKSYAYVGPNYNLIQFEDVFTPVIENITESASGFLTHYGGFSILKIFPELETLKQGDSQFGIVAMNSVDLSSSIVVKFCVKHNDMHFSIPPKVAGLKKQHTGKTTNLVKNYMSMVGKVKDVWKNIVNEFPKYRIVTTDEEKQNYDGLTIDFGDVVKKLKLGKKMTKKLKEEYENITYHGKYYTLWDLFTKIMDEISNKKFKSETHREKRIDAMCNAIFEYSFLVSI